MTKEHEEFVLKIKNTKFGGIDLKKNFNESIPFTRVNSEGVFQINAINLQWLLTTEEQIEKYKRKGYLKGVSVVSNFRVVGKNNSEEELIFEHGGSVEAPFSIAEIIFCDPERILNGNREHIGWSDYSIFRFLMDEATLEDCDYLINHIGEERL